MRFKKIFNIFLIVFFIAFTALFCLTKFKNIPFISGNNQHLEIYEWWHIESFEGGGANRQNYLNNLALEYEKQNPTQLFMIKNVAADQLEQQLSQSTPHLISFSEEVANIILPYLIEFNNEYNIQDNFLDSARYNGKLMALPYIASGYCYFTKTNSIESLETYTSNNNKHSASHLISQTINEGKTLTSYECYTKFVNSKNIQLLGTARDLFRLKNLESLGRFNINYEPVSSFTDLIQYLGKTSNSKNINKFIDFVLSDANQYKLSKLSLFSTKNLKLYSDPTYMEMENALKLCNTPNIFN